MHIVSGVFIEGETYVMRLQAIIVGVLLISLSRNGKDFSTKKDDRSRLLIIVQ